jgi:hypothetical protein
MIRTPPIAAKPFALARMPSSGLSAASGTLEQPWAIFESPRRARTRLRHFGHQTNPFLHFQAMSRDFAEMSASTCYYQVPRRQVAWVSASHMCDARNSSSPILLTRFWRSSANHLVQQIEHPHAEIAIVSVKMQPVKFWHQALQFLPEYFLAFLTLCLVRAQLGSCRPSMPMMLSSDIALTLLRCPRPRLESDKVAAARVPRQTAN